MTARSALELARVGVSVLVGLPFLLQGTSMAAILPFTSMINVLISHNTRSTYITAGALIFATVWISFEAQVQNSAKRLLHICLLAYCLEYLFAAAFVQNQVWADNCFLAVMLLSLGLTTCLLAGSAVNMARSFCVLGTLQGLYTITYYYLGIGNLVSGTVLRAGGTFGRPNFVYVIMIIGVPLGIALAMISRQLAYRWFWVFCSATMFVSLLLTWYRGGIIGLLLGLAWFTAMIRPKPVFIASIGLALTLTALLPTVIRTDSNTNQKSSNRSIAGRIVLWEKGLAVYRSHPILGTGAGCLRLAVLDSHGQISIYNQPDNLLILWLAEMGTVGGTLLLLICLSIVRIIKTTPGLMTFGMGASFIAVLVSGVSDTPLGAIDRVFTFYLVGLLLGGALLCKIDGGYPGREGDVESRLRRSTPCASP